MDEKRRFMDEICNLWTRLAFMDEKRRFMDEIRHLWMKLALMDEKCIFYGEKKYQPWYPLIFAGKYYDILEHTSGACH
jgi:hypothetical protein